ncbi:MAG: hypothetical protein ACRERE_29440 [Candidatus Entotheonellia bacterium]
MSTPSPRQPTLTPSMTRRLASLWAPLLPGNRALMQAAWKDPEVACCWRTYLEAYDAWLTLAPHAPEAQVALVKYATGRLHELLACLARQAPDVVRLFGPILPYFLHAAAEYRCTGIIPPWTPRKLWQPTPEMRISITPEGDVLGLAQAPRQHRRWMERYLDLMDAPRPGRLRGRGPTLEEMLTAARQLKRTGQVTQPRLMEQMGIRGDPRRVREWLTDLGLTWPAFKDLI